MSPRPRTVDDGAILEATGRVVGRVGPARLTLALVAREVGLSPATLLQRFGSKRKLLLAFVGSGGGGEEAFRERLLAEHRSPLERARAFLLCFAQMADTPEEMANHLAFLQIDLTDPAFRRLTLEIFEGHDRMLSGFLADAMKAGELQKTDARALARMLLGLATGSLMHWAIHREGTSAAWLARDVDLALAPYRRRRRQRGATPPRSSGR